MTRSPRSQPLAQVVQIALQRLPVLPLRDAVHRDTRQGGGKPLPAVPRRSAGRTGATGPQAAVSLSALPSAAPLTCPPTSRRRSFDLRKSHQRRSPLLVRVREPAVPRGQRSCSVLRLPASLRARVSVRPRAGQTALLLRNRSAAGKTRAVVAVPNGPRTLSRTERDHNSGQAHQIRWPGSPNCWAAPRSNQCPRGARADPLTDSSRW